MNLTFIISLLMLSLIPAGQDSQLIIPGRRIVREIASNHTHLYRLPLKKGQFIRLIADQRNVDIVLGIADAGGQLIAESDLTSYGSVESLSFEAPAESEYQITVRGLQPRGLAGSYELRPELRDAPTPEDTKRITGERLMTQAKSLRGQAAAEKCLQAAAIWRELGDEYWLARALIQYGDANRFFSQFEKAGQAADEALELARKNQDRLAEAAAFRLKGIASSMMGRFPQAIQFAEQDLAIRIALGDRVNEARTYSNLGILYNQLSQFAKSIEFFDKSIAICREIKDPANERFPLHNSGDTYNNLGRFELAIERFEQAIVAHRAAKDPFGEASSLDSLGTTFAYQGKHDKAAENIEKALAIRREIKDRNGEANSLTTLGMIAIQQGRNQAAIEYFNQALPIVRAIKARSTEARATMMLSQAYFGLSEFDKAEEYVNQALALNREMKSVTGEANALGSLGNINAILGRYELALENYRRALEIHRATKARTFEAASLTNLGITYNFLGQTDKAIEALEQAVALQRELKSASGIDLALNNLGNVYRSLGNNEKSIKYYEESLALTRQNGNKSSESGAAGNLLTAHHALGQYEKAREYGEQALALSRESKHRAVEARTLANLGNVYRALGRLPEAERSLKEGIALNREISNKLSESVAHFGLAELKNQKGDQKEALKEIEEAIRLHESLRSDLVSADFQSSFFAQTRHIYEFYIELLQQGEKSNPGAGYVERAFEASERSRARSLLEMLSESRVDIREGVDVKLLDRERLIVSQINAKARQLMQPLKAEQLAATKQELNALETSYQLTQAEIRNSSPAFAALTRPVPLKLSEIQAQLDADTLLLQYSLGERRSYLWVVGRDSLKSYELPKRSEIEDAARRLYALLIERGRSIKGETQDVKRARIEKADAELPAAARELSQKALAPLAGELKSQRLAIVADGALQYTPFGMLPRPAGGQSSAMNDKKTSANRTPRINDRALILDHEIVTLPSASTLAVQRRELSSRTLAPNRVAVIAAPVFSETDPRFKALARKQTVEPAPASPQINDLLASRSIEHLAQEEAGAGNARKLVIPALPFTRIEAERILAAAPGSGNFAALDFKANREAAFDPELSKSRYVHFATHGYLDSERPGLSALLLSMIDEKGEPQNGFLRANEIYNLKLSAELVVLSACQTGLGKEIRGEGLVGLTRGFMYAGAPRVVVSVWNVNDRATADLMESFYRKMLKENQRPAAALRSAQVEMLKNPQWRSPYYWAAFGLQGEWR